MSTWIQGESAKIYQFPVGGRAGVERLREEVTPTSAPTPRAAKVACGGSWYHEEAIEEDARDRQRTR